MLYQNHKQSVDRATSTFWVEARKNARAKDGDMVLVSAAGFKDEVHTYKIPNVDPKNVVFFSDDRSIALDISEQSPDSKVIFGNLLDIRDEFSRKFGLMSVQFDDVALDAALNELASTLCISGRDTCIFHSSFDADSFGSSYQTIVEQVTRAQQAIEAKDQDQFIANYMPIMSPIKIPWSNHSLDHKVEEFKKELKQDDVDRIINMFPMTRAEPIAKAFSAAGVISKYLFNRNCPSMIYGGYHEICDNKCRIHVFGQMKKYVINRKPERRKAELFTTGGYSIPLYNDFE